MELNGGEKSGINWNKIEGKWIRIKWNNIKSNNIKSNQIKHNTYSHLHALGIPDCSSTIAPVPVCVVFLWSSDPSTNTIPTEKNRIV